MHPKKLLIREVQTLCQSFQVEGIWNQKKNYIYNCLKEGLETHSTSIASITSTASTASGTTNYRCLIKERLESHLLSNHRQGLQTQPYSNQRHGLKFQPAATLSNLFIYVSNILKVISSPTKTSGTGYSLWRGHHCRMGIKDLTFAAHRLCKYTWEVVTYMILTGKGHLEPDIWPKALKQVESIGSMMSTMWNIETIRE